MVAEHSRISPTAKLVAYTRKFTDIPFSKEICLACGAEEMLKEIAGEDADAVGLFAPMVELRFKSTTSFAMKWIHKMGSYANILELAAGVSPRGMILHKRAGINYVETDLPAILKEKRIFASSVLTGKPLFGEPGGLKFAVVNAVEANDFEKLDDILYPGVVVVLNEGLLPYLSREEQSQVARNVYNLLKERGGVWITPDIYSHEGYQSLLAHNPALMRIFTKVKEMTGRDFKANAFDRMEDAENFFADIGFKIKRCSQQEVIPIHMLHSLKDEASCWSSLDHRYIWALEVTR